MTPREEGKALFARLAFGRSSQPRQPLQPRCPDPQRVDAYGHTSRARVRHTQGRCARHVLCIHTKHMITALNRAPQPLRPSTSAPSSLANWTLSHARGNSDLIQLQRWVSNEASADEVAALLQRAPSLLDSTFEQAAQRRLLSCDQRQTLSDAVAKERAHHVAVLPLLGATPETLWHSLPESLRRADCDLTAAGSVAGYWACQVQLAASIERAISRLAMPRELLLHKRKHSARCARNLIEWGRVSAIDLRAFPGTHRVASGITAMVERYCALTTTP